MEKTVLDAIEQAARDVATANESGSGDDWRRALRHMQSLLHQDTVLTMVSEMREVESLKARVSELDDDHLWRRINELAGRVLASREGDRALKIKIGARVEVIDGNAWAGYKGYVVGAEDSPPIAVRITTQGAAGSQLSHFYAHELQVVTDDEEAD